MDALSDTERSRALPDAADDSSVMNWEAEADAIIKDVGFALNSIAISTVIPKRDQLVYFNAETKEGCKFCIEMSLRGFRIVSDEFDTFNGHVEQDIYYETPYALFNTYSNGFRLSFGNALLEKLGALYQEQT